MSKNSKIEWTDHTFNPWIGCTKVSPACDHCYAEKSMPAKSQGITWGAGQQRKRTSAANWNQPLRWNDEAGRLGVRFKVFCASLADVFDNEVPREWRSDLFALIEQTPNLDWLLLTKRIGNVERMVMDSMCEMFHRTNNEPKTWPWPNVWLGATICNQEEADRDIPKLLKIPAAKRFLSIEPLLGAVDVFSRMTGELLQTSGNDYEPGWLDWIIVGGESGSNARPMHPDWARSLRDQCNSAGVPFFFKQWGEWGALGQSNPKLAHVWLWTKCSDQRQACVYKVGKKAAGRMLDGCEWNEVPT